jgi:predicted signal transduction protein with EAL and GGDEF domain
MRVVAEGVETQEQRSFLEKRKCSEAQGYYFSRPLKAEEFADLLRAAKPGPPVRASSKAAVGQPPGSALQGRSKGLRQSH